MIPLSNNIITIGSLANYQHHIPELAKLWYENIGQCWSPSTTLEQAEQKLISHCNVNQLPMTLVAFEAGMPIGMASLRINDGIRPDLKPWLGGLAVSKQHQHKGIGKQLVNAIKFKSKEVGYSTLYLLTFDKTIPGWYESLGWEIIGIDHLIGHPVTVMSIEL